MKVAHFCNFGLHGSGQYGTTKDLIKAERHFGIDARFIVTNGTPHIEDDWLKDDHPDWAKEADILVRHTAIHQEYEDLKKPTVCCLHGRPESTFTLDLLKKPPKPHQIPNYYQLKPQDGLLETIAGFANPEWNHYRALVYFWEEFELHWRHIIGPEKLRYVQAPVDLDEYKPEGPLLDFPQESIGEPNLLVADMWREDTTPFNVIHAAAYCREHYLPNLKVHVFGVPDDWNKPIKDVLFNFRDMGMISEIHYTIVEIAQIYRMMDITITPHNFATRVMRESLASGTPVVAGGGCPYTNYGCDPHDIPGYALQIKECWDDLQANPQRSAECRTMAIKKFNPRRSGEAMKRVFEEVLIGK